MIKKSLVATFFIALVLADLSAQNSSYDLDQSQIQSPIAEYAWNVQETQFESQGGLERIVLLIAFVEGDPQLSFIDPSGAVVALDDSRVEFGRFSWGIMAAVLKPQAGKWKVRLENTLGPLSYTVKVLGVGGRPALEAITPSFEKEPASSNFTVQGKVTNADAGQKISVVLSPNADSHTGPTVGTVTVGQGGVFSVPLDLSTIVDDEYHVAFVLDMGDQASVFAMAPGTLLVRHLEPLKAVKDVSAAGDENGNLEVSWTNTNGDRATGYDVLVTKSDNTVERIFVGAVTKIRIPGMQPGSSADVQIIAKDPENRESPASPKQHVTFAATADTRNKLTISSAGIHLTAIVGQGAIDATIPLSGTYINTGTALDYAQIVPQGILTSGGELVIDSPYIQIKAFDQRFKLPGMTSAPGLSLFVAATTPAGTYKIPLRVVSLGNAQNFVDYTVELEVKNPPVSIEKVTPERWLTTAAASVEVNGLHFFAGTRVFFDEIEVPLTLLEENKLSFDVAPGVSKGNHVVRVQGPSGDSASKTVYAGLAQYSLLGYKTATVAKAGEAVKFWVGIKGADSTLSQARLHMENLPAGWISNIEDNELSDGEQTAIAVQIPAGAASAAYQFIVADDEGTRMTLRTTVTGGFIGPFISGLSASSELAGRTVKIWGYAFGAAGGSLTIGEQTIDTSSWTNDEIAFVIPENTQSGLLRVHRAGGDISNGVNIYVKDFGFKIYAPRQRYDLQGGDKKDIELQLTGYQDVVNLQFSSSTPLISGYFSKADVIPVGGTTLSLVINKNIPEGTYNVTVKGISGHYEGSREIAITIGAAFTITTANLPAGSQGSLYSAVVETKNGQGKVSFSIKDGKLPLGLALSADGVIKGRAGEEGARRVVISAKDAEERESLKEYLIVIEETVWAMSGHDEGRSYAVSVDSPADGRQQWTTNLGAHVRGFLAGAGRLFAWTDTGIKALDSYSGKTVYAIEGSFVSALYSQGYLVVVDAGGSLRLFETQLGMEAWHRDGVAKVFIRQGKLIAQSGNDVLVLEIANGQLVAQSTGNLDGGLFGWKGALYRVAGNRIELWTPEQGWQVYYEDPQVPVAKVAADASGIAILTSNGKLLYGSDTGTMRTVNVGTETAFLTLAEDRIIVSGPQVSKIINRGSGDISGTLASAGLINAVGSREKWYSVSGQSLTAWNVYSGKIMWSADGPFTDLIMFGDRLFAASSSGTVICFNAPDNIGPPKSTLVTVPPAPDGKDGWFVSDVAVSLSVNDLETYASEINWKVGEGAMAPYTGGRTLTSGSYQIVFNSKDSKGWRELDQIANFKIDSVRPKTVWNITGLSAGKESYYWGPVQVSLSASDQGTGLDYTEYRLNDGPWTRYNGQTFNFTREGSNRISARSVDKAGGVETEQVKEFRLDFQIPTVAMETVERQGITFVYLYAKDSISPIDRIEYRIESGTAQIYDQVITLTSGGTWNLYYRAVDAAGRASEWKRETVRVHDDHDKALIDDLEYYDHRNRDREVIEDAKAGSRIFSSGRGETFKAIPDEVKGGLYFRNLEQDGKYAGSELFRFTTEAEVRVFYIKDVRSKANTDAWDELRTLPAGYLSSTTYFPQGATLLERSYPKGSSVSIPGAGLPANGGDLVFVVDAGWQGVEIIGPTPGDTLYAGTPVEIKLYAPQTPTDQEWSYRFDSGRWNTVKLVNGVFTLPMASDGQRLELRLQAKINRQRVEAYGYWTVQNKEGLSILDPKNNSKIITGQPFTPVSEVRDVRGNILSSNGVIYRLKQGSRLIAQGSGPFTIPTPGAYYLEAELKLPNGRTVGDTVSIGAVKPGTWIPISFWDKIRDIWKDRASWGFNRDGAEGRDFDVRVGNRHENLSSVVWSDGLEFTFKVAPGSYELRFLAGPDRAWAVHSIFVNDLSQNFAMREAGNLYGIHFFVNSPDGIIRIKATPGLPIYRMDYRWLAQNQTPSSNVEGIITTLE